ncbi:MAG: AAA family ATPase [bacterium]|nr:AAA family ATPase [bacterium]
MDNRLSIDSIKKIPYGIADYKLIRRENYYYVDKTRYLKDIKKAGRYLFFIRPRRFGKSLFLSMMEAYYDVCYKNDFDSFFQNTWIYANATRDKNSYLVLKFNFSLVNPDIRFFETSFLKEIRETALSFIRKYSELLITKDREYSVNSIKEATSPSDILSTLVRLCNDSHLKLYVIIDEYDNFANTILSTSGQDAYEKLTRGSGSFRAFFNVLKGGTEGPISRLFLTGVSPVTLDDVTSGYNIGKNITIDSTFSNMLGFTEMDVSEMLDYFRTNDEIQHSNDFLLELIHQWYGNYKFSPKNNTSLFNSDMVLYFLDSYLSAKELPDNLIDRNVRIDYGKLRHLILVDKDNAKKTNGNFKLLKEIIENGHTSTKIVQGFPLEKLTDSKNFKSLLFYLGLLSIDGVEKDKLRLTIPNETIKRLYYDYIEEAYSETGVFSLDLSLYADLMTNMAYDGKWKPLFNYISGRMSDSLSLRDLISGEKSIQAFLNVYLGLSDLYIIHPEKELNKGYANIVMEPFLARYDGISYSYLLEIKYTKSGAKAEDIPVKKLITAAEKQLESYGIDKKFRKNIKKTTLIKLVLVFSGHKLIYIDHSSRNKPGFITKC